MNTIMNLIDEFKSEQTSKLNNIDLSQKPRIVSALEDFADDQTVSDFYFSVALDEQEYDLARIEVLKILEVKDFVNLDVRKKAADIIRQVLSQSKDEDVRNYAAMAAASYMDNEELVGEIERILLDASEPSNLRWNAFAAVKSNGVSQRSTNLLRTLMPDDEFKQSAARVLSEWGA